MLGAPLAVPAEEMDAFNDCMQNFANEIVDRCPHIRLIGIFAGAPNPEGTYGVLGIASAKVSYEQFADITKEMGKWMQGKATQ